RGEEGRGDAVTRRSFSDVAPSPLRVIASSLPPRVSASPRLSSPCGRFLSVDTIAFVRRTPSPIVPVIVGPTASGKSELGINLALALDGEIVNLDSVQVYRGLYVATAKVPPSQRRGIPHHLNDIVSPTENFTAGQYARLAANAIRDIESRGKTAILVGGTGFYLRALVRPLFESPPTDLNLRERLVELRRSRGVEHLHRILERVDPTSARRISPRDWSRTMRALEYRFQTRCRLSDVQPQTPAAPEVADRIRVIASNPPRQELYQRINHRSEMMFRAG